MSRIFKKRSTYHLTAGFTLIELAIVVTIIGLLATIAIPAFMKWVPHYRLKAATQELYGNMQKAKLNAIKTNSNVTAAFITTACPPDGGSYTFTNVRNGRVVASRELSGICLTSGSVNGFDPRGLPVGSSGSITLKHTRISRTYTISQSLAGVIRVQ